MRSRTALAAAAMFAALLLGGCTTDAPGPAAPSTVAPPSLSPAPSPTSASPTPTPTPEATSVSPSPDPTLAKDQYDESYVIKYLGLTGSPGNYEYSYEDGETCDVAVVMTSAAQVHMYDDAGDNVAADPTGTVGVKIVDPEGDTCNKVISEDLAKFK
jgi:hypothetical protein